jgi:hypothetical protein
MKKNSMILALVLALTMAFVFIGCGGNLGQVDATGAMNVAAAGDGGWEPPEGDDLLFVINVEKNEYSNGKDDSLGNQAKVSLSQINVVTKQTIAKLTKDDEYAFSITFEPDRGGTPDANGTSLSVALIDTSTKVGYWDVRGEWSGASGSGAEVGDEKGYLNVPKLERGKEVTFKGTLKVIASAKEDDSGSLWEPNLVFAMEAQPWAKEVKFYVTAFSFKKIEATP